MGAKRALTLIVARPGPLREGVEALVATVSRVKIVGRVGAAAPALRLVREHHPDLLLLDAGLPRDESVRVLRTCCRDHGELRCIVLADDAEQAQEASAAGADAVFLKGFPADKFVQTVERLLSDR